MIFGTVEKQHLVMRLETITVSPALQTIKTY